MAVWADLADCTDPVVVVAEQQLDAADIEVRALLRGLGIPAASEADISDDGRALLRRYAVQVATAEAALASMSSGGMDDLMAAKHRAFRDGAKLTAARVDRESLGLAAAGSGSAGYASITVGRA